MQYRKRPEYPQKWEEIPETPFDMLVLFTHFYLEITSCMGYYEEEPELTAEIKPVDGNTVQCNISVTRLEFMKSHVIYVLKLICAPKVFDFVMKFAVIEYSEGDALFAFKYSSFFDLNEHITSQQLFKIVGAQGASAMFCECTESLEEYASIKVHRTNL